MKNYNCMCLETWWETKPDQKLMYSKVKIGLNYYFNGLKYSKFIILYVCAGDIMFYNCKYNPRRIWFKNYTASLRTLLFKCNVFQSRSCTSLLCRTKRRRTSHSYDATYINKWVTFDRLERPAQTGGPETYELHSSRWGLTSCASWHDKASTNLNVLCNEQLLHLKWQHD